MPLSLRLDLVHRAVFNSHRGGNWRSIGQSPPQDMHEHGTLLLINTKDLLLSKIQEKEAMPSNVM